MSGDRKHEPGCGAGSGIEARVVYGVTGSTFAVYCDECRRTWQWETESARLVSKESWCHHVVRQAALHEAADMLDAKAEEAVENSRNPYVEATLHDAADLVRGLLG